MDFEHQLMALSILQDSGFSFLENKFYDMCDREMEIPLFISLKICRL